MLDGNDCVERDLVGAPAVIAAAWNALRATGRCIPYVKSGAAPAGFDVDATGAMVAGTTLVNANFLRNFQTSNYVVPPGFGTNAPAIPGQSGV